MNAKELKKMVFNCLKDQDGINYPEGSLGYMLMQYKSDLLDKYSAQLCKEQRELVADELKRYSEDLSIPNQYKINDLCMDAPMPEL